MAAAAAAPLSFLCRNEQEIDRSMAEMEELEETLVESIRWRRRPAVRAVLCMRSAGMLLDCMLRRLCTLLACRHTCLRQAGRRAGGQAGRQAGRQASLPSFMPEAGTREQAWPWAWRRLHTHCPGS